MSIVTAMDNFLSQMSTTDTKDRLSVGARILDYLSNPCNSIACNDIGFFIDTLILWMQSSNFKVVQLDLEILIELVSHMNGNFHPYLSTSIPHLIDKLGDSKETIREKTLALFCKLVECNVLSVQQLFDRIAAPCFSHKNSNVREEIMHLLTDMLSSYGASSLHISKLTPYLVKLLGDPNASVRQTAFDTICELYKHVGDRLRTDLQKKHSIPHNKLPALLAKFDEIKTSDCSSMFRSMSINGDDETDKSEYQFESMSVSAYRPPITPSALSASCKKQVRKTVPAGAVTEDLFAASFEDVPTMQLYSPRDVEDCLKKCQIIGNESEDWKKRVGSLKSIRSLIVAGGLEYEEFLPSLLTLLPAFEAALKDLRSQIVREACITVAYLSKKLGNKLDRMVEALLENLIGLIQNSAKVMASSGLVCIRYVLQHTHSPRLIPIVTKGLTSKSKEIRRACCEFVNIVLQTWPVPAIEKHAAKVQDAIKKGIMDADPEARMQSRNAYSEFAQHFPELADSLKNSLDPSYRKLLSSSCTGSTSSLSRVDYRPGSRAYTPASCRSNSAIDLQAANRAKIRAQYAAMDRQKIGTPPKKPTPEPRSSRTKSRVSVSQPTSRSGSPSSRVAYTQYLECTPRSRRSSTDNASRDNSLTRSGFKSHLPVRKPSFPKRDAEYALSDLDYLRSRQFKLEDHDSVDKDSTSYDSGISQMSSGDHYDLPEAQKDGLKTYIEELSNADEQTRKELLNKMVLLAKEGPSDAIVTHFKHLLGKIIALISESQPAAIKEAALLLLQTVVKRKTVTFLLKQYSDLIIIRVIAVCGDGCKEVAKAAENCAIVLSTYLPAESVIRVIVPLIPSETAPVKLVSIKMLTRAIECSDETVTTAYLDQIMPVMLLAYDDPESSVRKAAVFCMVAVHKQSEEMKVLLEPYVSKLQGAKLKLLQLYIRRAEQGSSMPTSPRCV